MKDCCEHCGKPDPLVSILSKIATSYGVMYKRLLRIESILACSSGDPKLRKWGQHLTQELRCLPDNEISSELLQKLLNSVPSLEAIASNPFSAKNQDLARHRSGLQVDGENQLH